MRLRAGRPQCHGKFRRRTVELVDTGTDAGRAETRPAARCAHCRGDRGAIAVRGAGARATRACAGQGHAIGRRTGQGDQARPAPCPGPVLGRGTGQGDPARPRPHPGQINPPTAAQMSPCAAGASVAEGHLVTLHTRCLNARTDRRRPVAARGADLRASRGLAPMGTDEDGDEITVGVVSDEEVRTAPRSAWPKSLSQLLDAITTASIDSGFDHRIINGPMVRAVLLERVRAVYRRNYIVAPDSESRDEAVNKAFSRALKTARDARLIGGTYEGGKQVVWIAKEATTP